VFELTAILAHEMLHALESQAQRIADVLSGGQWIEGIESADTNARKYRSNSIESAPPKTSCWV
jgi:hypothetical protein